MKKTGCKIYRIASIFTVIAIAVTIFILSSESGDESAQTSSALMELLNKIFKGDIAHEFLRSVGHFCEYAALGFFVCNAFFAFKEKPMPIKSIVISFLYAVTDEMHQIFVPDRAFQLSDLAIDLGGIAAGTVVFVILVTIIRKRGLKKRKTVN